MSEYYVTSDSSRNDRPDAGDEIDQALSSADAHSPPRRELLEIVINHLRGEPEHDRSVFVAACSWFISDLRTKPDRMWVDRFSDVFAVRHDIAAVLRELQLSLADDQVEDNRRLFECGYACLRILTPEVFGLPK